MKIRNKRRTPTQAKTREQYLWGAINQRLQRDVSYTGCSNQFESLQEFKLWLPLQVGYQSRDNNGEYWQLDKDIAFPGNKVYSPDTCVFVPRSLNSLFKAKSGELPIGVSFHEASGKWCSRISSSGWLGIYDTPLEAHKAWQRAKIEQLRDLDLSGLELDIKVYTGMKSHISKIESDMTHNRVSKL